MLHNFKLAGYIRLSPSDEVREEGSLVSHPQRIEEFVKLKNAQVPGWGNLVDFYVDEEVSGSHLNRPNFLKMLKDVKSGKVNGIIVTELSRLSRDVKDFMQFWDFLRKYNCKFFSLRENFDTSTPVGEMMVIQCISFAQFERKNTIERIKAGARARAQRGLANGGGRILGYDPNPTKKNHLVVNDAEALRIKLIYSKYLEFQNISKTRRWLNEQGYKTKEYTTKEGKLREGTSFTDNSLYRILTNKVYIGIRQYNQKNKDKDQSQLADSEKYFEAKAIWEPIIEEKIFEEVQKIIQKNRLTSRKCDRTYLLSNILRCGECGSKLVGMKANGSNQTYYYYAHNRKYRSTDDQHKKRCSMERIPAEDLEKAVLKRLKGLSKNRDLITELAKYAKDTRSSKRPDVEKMLGSKKKELKSLESKISNLTERLAILPADIPAESFLEKIKTFGEDKKKVKKEVDRLKSELESAQENIVDLEWIFKALQTFRRNFGKLAPIQQKGFIEQLIESVTVSKDKVYLNYYGRESENFVIEEESDLEKEVGGSKNNKGRKLSRPFVRANLHLVEVARIELASGTSSKPGLRA